MKGGRSGWALAGVAALIVVLVAGSVLLWQRPDGRGTSTADDLVTSDGTGLRLNGLPWWPTGFNAYQLATDWSINAGCGAQVNLDQYFGALPPHSLTRFSLFAPFTVRADDATIDFRAADAVFDAAARHGQLVLPVLSSGDGACDGGSFKDEGWYADGWRSLPVSPHGTFADWVRTAVGRWKDAPALAGWTATGEPEPGRCVGDGDCHSWRNRSCPADANAVLRRFFDDTGALIRSVDPRHLIFAGLLGGDQCGVAGDGFSRLGESPGIDVLEFHDYSPSAPTTVPAPATVSARISQARALGKPVVITEIGEYGGSCLPLPDRAARVRAAIDLVRAEGAAGALAWSFVPDPRPTECTYDIGPGDPLWPRLTDP
ncbi:beta-mannosidase [Gordonia sp. (in: high G+C Gram-positive bacteria)]|uniref:beta-mannosidase n=1 Tax=Gordonia sp. (in: high G+C Gram-positive bacteria) TaxID=84139 RepID=UPI003526F49A